MTHARARVLPLAEWGKLAHYEPYATHGLPNPDHWEFIVSEIDGEIVAHCSIFDTVHWDGFFVEEQYRANPVVFGSLLERSLQTLREHGVAGVHLTVPNNQPELEAMVERFGFVPAPGKLYICAVPPPPKESA